MKSLGIAIIAAFLLAACGSDSPSSAQQSSSATISLQNTDLTGTWLRALKISAFNTDTNEYVGYVTHTQTIYLFDSSEGISAFNCFEYTEDSLIITNSQKTENYLYLDIEVIYQDTPYAVVSENEFAREYSETYKNEFDPDNPWRDDIEERLIRISDDIKPHNGTLSFSSPSAMTFNQNTCLWVTRHASGTIKGIALLEPYGGEGAGIGLMIQTEFDAGVYEYEAEEQAKKTAVNINLFRNVKFYSDAGMDPDISYKQVNTRITISSANEDRITGSFSFNQEPYVLDPTPPEVAPESIHFEGEFDISLEHHKIPNF